MGGEACRPSLVPETIRLSLGRLRKEAISERPEKGGNNGPGRAIVTGEPERPALFPG